LPCVCGLCGLVLAWYIPKAAEAKFDPLAEARNERDRMLEAKALARFGNSAAATEWLEKRNLALGNKSPRAAAADVDVCRKRGSHCR
jgi:Protein of unknown function (DUF2384)